MIDDTIPYKAGTIGKGPSSIRAQAPSWNLSHLFLWTNFPLVQPNTHYLN